MSRWRARLISFGIAPAWNGEKLGRSHWVYRVESFVDAASSVVYIVPMLFLKKDDHAGEFLKTDSWILIQYSVAWIVVCLILVLPFGEWTFPQSLFGF
jgi:hypothetical protein